MHVAFGRLQRRVPQQDAHGLRRDALFVQTRGEAVTQAVRLDQGTVQADFWAGLPECGLHSVGTQGAGALTVGEKPWLGSVRAPRLSQIEQQRLGQGRKPLFVALADYAKHHVVAVHAIHRQRQSLANAQAAVIHALANDPIQRYANGGKERLALGVF